MGPGKSVSGLTTVSGPVLGIVRGAERQPFCAGFGGAAGSSQTIHRDEQRGHGTSRHSRPFTATTDGVLGGSIPPPPQHAHDGQRRGRRTAHADVGTVHSLVRVWPL